MLVAQLQNKLNSQHCRVSTIKVRALIGKEWDPGDWNGNIWEAPDEARDTEPLNSDVSRSSLFTLSLQNTID